MMAKSPTFLNEAVAFDEPLQSSGAGGVTLTEWTERRACRGEFIYSRGSEVVEAARLEGRPIYKVRIRQCIGSRLIDTTWRMRDTRRGLPVGEVADALPGTRYSIREVDAITDRGWIYILVEGGKAP